MKVVDEVAMFKDLADRINKRYKGVKLVDGKPVPMTEEEWKQEMREIIIREDEDND